jgi:anti-sigma regulatory factor (Ser/Thr protein kinase)
MRNDECNVAMIRHSIPSDLAEVDAVCREVRALLERQGVANRYFAVDLLLREFLNNAILHGNCSDTRKQVQVQVRVGRKWIVLWIADEGPGFDWRAKRRAPPDEDATSGRGLAIGTIYAHRLRFNRAGNQVTSWIRKTESKESTS